MKKLIILSALCLSMAACANCQISKVFTKEKHTYKKGVCSWYGEYFHGRTMANGKIYNMYDPRIVAHYNLPFGTRVELVNKKTGQSAIAVVSDRGAFKRKYNRDFDLSRALAIKLGIFRQGVATLDYRVIENK